MSDSRNMSRIIDTWSDVEPEAPFSVPLEMMTQREIDEMIASEMRAAAFWDAKEERGRQRRSRGKRGHREVA